MDDVVAQIPVKPKTINGMHRRHGYTVEFVPAWGGTPAHWKWTTEVHRTYRSDGEAQSPDEAVAAAKAKIDIYASNDDV